MASLTSSLTIKLIDDVSKPARNVAQALKDAERKAKDMAKAMANTGATDRLQKSLSGLKLSAKDIETVAAAWKDYSKTAGLAARSSDWTKAQIADVRAWERQTIGALREVRREQAAFNRSVANARGGGLDPIAHGLSANVIANNRLARGMSSSGAAAEVKKAEAKAREKAEAGGTMVLPLGGGLLPLAGGYGAYHAGKRIVEAGAERQHVRVGALNAGMPQSEVARAEQAATMASRGAPNMSVSQILELHKEARSAVQHPEEVFHLIPMLAKAASVFKGMGVENANIAELVKGGESLGLMNDPKRFEKYLEANVKSMQVFGRTISTEQIYEAAKYSKSAGATLSDDFLSSVMPTLIQEMHGSSAGDAIAMPTIARRHAEQASSG